MIVLLVLVLGAIFGETLHTKAETTQRTETTLNQSPFNINKFATLIENYGKEKLHTICNTTSTDRKKRTIEKNCNNKLYVNNTNPNKFLKKGNIQLTEENLPLQKQVCRETSQLDKDDEASDITDDIKNKTFEQNTTEQLTTDVEDSELNEPHLRRTGHYRGIDVDKGINNKKSLQLYPTRTTLRLAFEEHNKKFHKTVDLKGEKFELLPFYAANSDENIVNNENADTPAREIYEKKPTDGVFTNETKSTTTETIYYSSSTYEKGEGESNERVEDKDDASDNPVNTTSDLLYKIKKVIFDEEKGSLPHNVLDDSKQESKGDEEKDQQQNRKSAKDDDLDNDTEKEKDMKPASDLEKNAESEKDNEKDESDKEELSDFEFEKDKNIDEVLDNYRGKSAERENYRDDNVDTDKDTNIGVKPDVELNKNSEEEVEPKHDFSIVSNRKAFDDEDSFDGLPLRDSLPNYPIRPYYNRYSQGSVLPKEVLKRTTRDYSVRTRKLNHGIFVDEVARPHIDIFDDSDDKNRFDTSVHANISQKGKTVNHPSYNKKDSWNVTPKKENKNMVSTTEKDDEYYDNDTEITTETKRINRVKQKNILTKKINRVKQRTMLNRIPSSIDKYLMKVSPTKKKPQYDKARQEMSMRRRIITPRTFYYEKMFTTESVDAAYVATKPIKHYSHKNKKKENKSNLLRKFDKSLPNSTNELHLVKPLSPSVVALQETLSNNTLTTATQEAVYKATPPTFFKNTIKKNPDIPKMKFGHSQVKFQNNKSYNKVHKAQTTTSPPSATSSSTSSSSLSVIIETTPRTTTKKSVKKYPQKPKLGLITKNLPISRTFALIKKEPKIDKHNLTSTTLATTTRTQSLKHNASTCNTPVFNHTEHTKYVNSIDKNAILSTSLNVDDYSSTVITTRKIRVPNSERSTSTKIPKIYENTIPVAYHNKVIPLKKSQREKNLKTTMNVIVKSTLNTVTTTEMEGEYGATPASNAQFVSYLPKNKTDSTLLNNDLEKAKKYIVNASEYVYYRVLPLNETIQANNSTEYSKNLQLVTDQNLASTVGFYKHNKLSVHDRPISKVSLQVISTPNSLNPKPESDGEFWKGYEDYDDTVDNNNNINDEAMYTTKSLIWTTSTKENSIIQLNKPTMRDQKASANVSESVAENVLNILLKKKPVFSKNYIQNVSNNKVYSNKIMSLYKALIQTSLDVLLDKSTYNKTWYKIASSTENPRNETNTLEEESVARLFDETFSKGIYSNLNFYHVDNTSKTERKKSTLLNEQRLKTIGENVSSPAQDTKYVEEFDVSNVFEDRDDKFDNEHLFRQPDSYAYDYPRTKTVVETILNIILNKSIASNDINRTRNKSLPIYQKVVETVLNKFLHKSRNSSKEVFGKNTEKISTTSDRSADRLFIKEFNTNHTVNNDTNSTSYLKALSSNVTLYETSTGKEITLHVASFEDNKNNVEQNKTLPTNKTLHEANSKGTSTTLERFTQIHLSTVINPLRNKTLLNRVTETPLELTTGLETAVNKPNIDVIHLTTISPSTKEFTRTGFTGEPFLERINALATNQKKNEKVPSFENLIFDKNMLHDSRSMTSSPLFDKEKPHTTSTTSDDHKSTAEEISLKFIQHLLKTNSPTFYKKYNVTLLSNSTTVTKTTVTEMSVDTSTTENETIAYFKFLNTGTAVIPNMDSESHVHDTEGVSHSRNYCICPKKCMKNEQDVTIKTTIKNDTKNKNNILNIKQNETEKENITHETDNDKINKELIKLLHPGLVHKTLIDDEIYTTSEIAKEYIKTETTTKTTNDEVYTTFDIAKEYVITKRVNTASENKTSSSITTAITRLKDANVTEKKEFQNTTVTDISEETHSQLNETVPTHHAIANETTTNIVLGAKYFINNNKSKYIIANTSEVKDLKTSSIKPTDKMQSSTMPFLHKPPATNDSVRELYNTSATLENLLQGTEASQTWTLKAEDRQLDIFSSEETNNTNEPYPSITSATTINLFLQNGSKLNETSNKKVTAQIRYSVLTDKETPVEDISKNFVTTGKQSVDDHSITPDCLVTTKLNDKLNSTNFDDEIFGAGYSKKETDFNTTLSTEKISQMSAIETFINNSLSDIKYWNATVLVNDSSEDMEFLENEIRKNVNLLENKFKEIENMAKSNHTASSTTEHMNAIAPLETIKSATEYKVGPDEVEVFYNKIPVTEEYFTKKVISHNKSLNLERTSIPEYPTTSSTTVKNVSYINETDIIRLPAHSNKPTDKVLQIILLNKTRTKSDNKSHEESSRKLPSISPTTIRVESDGKNNFEYSTVRDKITNKEFSKTSPSDSNATQVFDYSNLENVLRKVLINIISNHEVSTNTSQSTAKNGENINFGYEPKDKITQYKELSNTLGSATHPIKVSIDESNLENIIRHLLLNKTYKEGSPDLSYEYSTVSANRNDFEKSLPHLTHEVNKFVTKSQPDIISLRGPNLEKKLQQLLLSRTITTETPLRVLTNFNPYEQLLSKLYWSMLLENVARRKQIPAHMYPTEPILVPNSPKYSDAILERPQVAIQNNEMTTFKPYTANAFKDGKIPNELDLLSDIVFPKKFPAKNTSQLTKEFQPKEAVVAADQTLNTTRIPKLTTSDWLLQSYLDIKPAIQSYFGDKTDISERLLNNIRLLGKLYSKEFKIKSKPLITNQSSQATEAEATSTLADQETIPKVPDAEMYAERKTDIMEKIPIREEPSAITQPQAGILPEKPLIYEESITKIKPEIRTNISYHIPYNNGMPSAVYHKQPVLKKPIAVKDQILYKNKVDTANLTPVARNWPFQRFFYNKSNIYSYYEKSPINFKEAYTEKPVQSHRNKTGKTTVHINVCGIDNAPLKTVEQGIDRIERYPWLGVLIYPKDRERLVTTVVLITVQLVVASALDIDKLPKENFRSCAKVVLGRNCRGPRIGVLNYNYHPDFKEGLYNSLALIQIDSAAMISRLRPICPPPKVLVGPDFYAMVVPEDCRSSNISVYEMVHVPVDTCRRYYTSIGLDIKSLWPRYVACGKMRNGGQCVWRAGAILLVKQDFKWHLLGFGVSGPGCEAPSRFVDYGMYSDWVTRTVERMGQPAITKLAPNQLIMRRSINQLQRFGLCDPEEKKTEIFSDTTEIQAPADLEKHQAGRVQYNLTILSDVDYHCVILHAYNLRGLEHIDPPKLVLRRYCQSPPAYCFSGPGLIKIDFYLTIYFFHAIRYRIQAYGQETKTVDAKTLTKYANKKRDYPENPMWGETRRVRRRRFKFGKRLEKYKNSFTYQHLRKTGRRSRRKALKKLNEEKQREKEERLKKEKVEKEKYKNDIRKQFEWLL